jgi:ribosomal protein S25
MGCNQSHATAVKGRNSTGSSSSSKKTSKSKQLEIVEGDPDETEKMREDMLQRIDSEVDMSHQFSAEREALKELCANKIIRKLSFEDLLDSFSTHDYEKLAKREYCYQIQKEFRIKTLKQEIKERKKAWVVSALDLARLFSFLRPSFPLRS